MFYPKIIKLNLYNDNFNYNNDDNNSDIKRGKIQLLELLLMRVLYLAAVIL